MPFVFSRAQQYNAGRVIRYDVPAWDFLGTAWEQGIHDQIFASVGRFTEDQLFDGPDVSADEANQKYGIPGELRFDRPVSEERARAMRSRKEAEMRRNYILTQGAPGGFFSGRGLLGLGTSTIANIMSPVDLAVNFVPIIGSERAALRAASLGRGAVRQYLERGIITSEEAVGKYVPYPRLAGSIVNGGVGAAISDVPHLVQAMRDQEQYGVREFFISFGASAALAGALNLAGKALLRVSSATRETMFRKSVEQTLRGEDVRVAEVVRIDEAEIRDRVKFREEYERERALLAVDTSKVRERVLEKNEYPILAAWRNPETDRVRSGVAHWMIDVTDWEKMHGTPERGYITNKRRYVAEEEGAFLQGKLTPQLISEELPGNFDLDALPPQFRQFYDNLREGGATDAEASSEIIRLIQRNQEDAFFNRPETKELVEQETQRAVDEHVANERAKYDEEGAYQRELRAEIERQVEAGRTLTPEQRDKWRLGDTPEKDTATLKEQETELTQEIRDLEEELGQELSREELSPSTLDAAIDKIDEMVKKLSKPSNKLFTGVTGLEPIIALVGKVVARNLLIALREGLKVTRTLYGAVDYAMEWWNKNHKKVETRAAIMEEVPKAKEELRALVREAREKGDAEAEEKWMKLLNPGKQSRRSFLSAIGRGIAAMQVAPTSLLKSPKQLLTFSKVSIGDLYSASWGLGKRIHGVSFEGSGGFEGGLGAKFSDLLRESKMYKRLVKETSDEDLLTTIKNDFARYDSGAVVLTGGRYAAYEILKRAKIEDPNMILETGGGISKIQAKKIKEVLTPDETRQLIEASAEFKMREEFHNMTSSREYAGYAEGIPLDELADKLELTPEQVDAFIRDVGPDKISALTEEWKRMVAEMEARKASEDLHEKMYGLLKRGELKLEGLSAESTVDLLKRSLTDLVDELKDQQSSLNPHESFEQLGARTNDQWKEYWTRENERLNKVNDGIDSALGCLIQNL